MEDVLAWGWDGGNWMKRRWGLCAQILWIWDNFSVKPVVKKEVCFLEPVVLNLCFSNTHLKAKILSWELLLRTHWGGHTENCGGFLLKTTGWEPQLRTTVSNSQKPIQNTFQCDTTNYRTLPKLMWISTHRLTIVTSINRPCHPNLGFHPLSPSPLV
jgi:hypothetical protein